MKEKMELQNFIETNAGRSLTKEDRRSEEYRYCNVTLFTIWNGVDIVLVKLYLPELGKFCLPYNLYKNGYDNISFYNWLKEEFFVKFKESIYGNGNRKKDLWKRKQKKRLTSVPRRTRTV
jgi:hypothetical protein